MDVDLMEIAKRSRAVRVAAKVVTNEELKGDLIELAEELESLSAALIFDGAVVVGWNEPPELPSDRTDQSVVFESPQKDPEPEAPSEPEIKPAAAPSKKLTKKERIIQVLSHNGPLTVKQIADLDDVLTQPAVRTLVMRHTENFVEVATGTFGLRGVHKEVPPPKPTPMDDKRQMVVLFLKQRKVATIDLIAIHLQCDEASARRVMTSPLFKETLPNRFELAGGDDD
jgi:hypothetical protein